MLQSGECGLMGMGFLTYGWMDYCMYMMIHALPTAQVDQTHKRVSRMHHCIHFFSRFLPTQIVCIAMICRLSSSSVVAG